MGRPSEKYYELMTAREATKKELSEIKSIQVEFVKHSKLERKIIKIEKDIDSIKSTDGPKAEKINFILRIVRVSILIFTLNNLVILENDTFLVCTKLKAHLYL